MKLWNIHFLCRCQSTAWSNSIRNNLNIQNTVVNLSVSWMNQHQNRALQDFQYLYLFFSLPMWKRSYWEKALCPSQSVSSTRSEYCLWLVSMYTNSFPSQCSADTLPKPWKRECTQGQYRNSGGLLMGPGADHGKHSLVQESSAISKSKQRNLSYFLRL